MTINKASIIEIPNNEAFCIYPNPASDILHILTNSNHIGAIYAIKSISGQKILGGKIEREDTIINIRELLDGIYFIHLGSDIRQSFKIIKQQPHE